MEMKFQPKKVALFLGIIIIFLILAHIVVKFSTFYLGHDTVFGIVPLFDLDKEKNIPTFYSSVLLLFCSLLLAITAFVTKKKGKHDFHYWIGLAVIFLFLSIDEFTTIHELLIEPLRSALNTSGFFYFAWVIPYGISVIIFLLLYLRFLINLPIRIRLLFIIAGVIYIAGAIGLELVGGYYYELQEGQRDLTYVIITSFEESLEMVGILIFIYALMLYIDSELNGLYLRITSS